MYSDPFIHLPRLEELVLGFFKSHWLKISLHAMASCTLSRLVLDIDQGEYEDPIPRRVLDLPAGLLSHVVSIHITVGLR